MFGLVEVEVTAWYLQSSLSCFLLQSRPEIGEQIAPGSRLAGKSFIFPCIIRTGNTLPHKRGTDSVEQHHPECQRLECLVPFRTLYFPA